MAISKELMKRMNKLQKTYDKEMVSIASERTDRDIISHSTGSLMLDLAMGANKRSGFPEGRIIEVYGPESAGKTSVCILAIAARQQEEDYKESVDPSYVKKACVFVDAEHAFDSKLAEEYGVNLDELIYINPDTSERAMDALDLLVRSGDVGLAIVDSVPALVPSSIEESSYEQQHIGTLARFMSGVCQRLTGPLFKTNTTVVFINQVRDKIGGYSPVGTPETTPGGRALKFSSTLRLSVRRGESIKNGNELVGHQMKIRVVKNKIAAPFKEAAVNLIYGEGIDKADELFQVALKSGLIKQGGAWFSYVTSDGELVNIDGQDIKAQGRDRMIELIRSIPLLYGELEDKIRGVDVEADEMSPEEIEAQKAAEKEAEESSRKAGERAYAKNKKALKEKLDGE